MKKTCLLITSAFLLFSVIAQKQSISMNLKTGVTYYQTSVSTSAINQVVQGQDFKMTTTVAGMISYKVLSFTDSLYELQTTYDSLAMAVKMPQGESSFSSGNMDNIFSIILSKIKGYPFKVYMYKTGKIKNIIGIPEMIERALSDFESLPETQRNQIIQQLMQAYGEKAFKGSFETVTNIFPEKPVSVNDKWNVTTQMETLLAATRITTYSLTQMNGDTYTIEGASETQTENKDAYMPIRGATTRYNLKGRTVSKFVVDKKSGWVLEAKANDTFSGTIVYKDDKGEVVTIPVEMLSIMNITGM